MFTCTGVEATPLLISEAGIRRKQNSFTQIFILLSCLACFHVHVILKCRNKIGQAQSNRLRNGLPPDVTYHLKIFHLKGVVTL